ncbi:ATP-binding cassette domain-containing protein [Arcanobacterium hippocoleae]
MPATALETVASGLLFGNHLWKPRDWKARTMFALEQVGLAYRAHESFQTFSGGQQQRILIARAIVRQPQLLILDEPFAGVDTESRNKIVEILAKMRENNTTVIAVLHDIYDLEPLIDTTFYLKNGNIEKITETKFDPIVCTDKTTGQV